MRDDLLRDSAMHLRNGIYNASTNEICFNPTGNLVDDQHSLTHLILLRLPRRCALCLRRVG